MQVCKNAWQGLLFSSFTWKELRSCQVKKAEQTSTTFLGYRWQWTTQDRLLPPRLERPTGKYRDLWLHWNRGNHHGSQCRGRKTWAVLTNCWGLSAQLWDFRSPGEPSHRDPHNFVRFTSRGSTKFSQILEKNSFVLPAGRGKMNHFQICRSTVFWTRPALRRNGLIRTWPAGFYQSLITEVGERKYPTPVPSSHPNPPNTGWAGGEEENWERRSVCGTTTKDVTYM